MTKDNELNIPLQAIPEGFALVPIEPTEEMTQAGREATQCIDWDEEEIYKAMIGAYRATN